MLRVKDDVVGLLNKLKHQQPSVRLYAVRALMQEELEPELALRPAEERLLLPRALARSLIDLLLLLAAWARLERPADGEDLEAEEEEELRDAIACSLDALDEISRRSRPVPI